MMATPSTDQAGQQLKVSEIFYSLQGESSFAGLPCVFVRLGGCNLRCNYCDASYTWEEREVMDMETICSAIESYPCDLVEVTGGEPLYQANTPDLLRRLLEIGKRVLLETNGSMDISSVPEDVTVILDVKCPDSGSADSFHPANISEIKKRHTKNNSSVELKFVLSSQIDYNWAREFISGHDLEHLPVILFSPVIGRLPPTDLASWIMTDGFPVRLQLQLHTILWPEISRGV